MYDRSSTERTASNGFAPYPTAAPSKQYPNAHSTSSAFSASANPNEDWTKISDLAERRRIQNRIAQRNYRKKLKKRLEDLERRAGSSSASPEPQLDGSSPGESTSSSHKGQVVERRGRADSKQLLPEASIEEIAPQAEDRGMFSQQYTRQLSTSPPPFSYGSSPPTQHGTYSTYPPAAGYYSISGNAVDAPMYPQYLQSFQQTNYQSATGTTHSMAKPGSDPYEDEMNPFGMSYATMAGAGIAGSQMYPSMATYVSTTRHRPAYHPPQSSSSSTHPTYQQRSSSYANYWPPSTG